MNIEDRCLGLVRSLGLAESHSINLMRGGQFRLKAHARDIYSQVAGWYLSASLESIEALDNFYLFPTIDKKSWKIQDMEIPCKKSIAFFHEIFLGGVALPVIALVVLSPAQVNPPFLFD